ncbi:unnamed protein product [Schistosoma mattheei]|nr:unnamed protein product [Schistosoma mattheei]
MQLTQKTFISPRPPGPLFTCQQSGLRQQIQQRLPLPQQQQQQRHPHHQVQLESSGFRPMGSGLPLNNCRIPMNNDGILGSANPSTGVISGGGGRGVMHMQWSNNNSNQTTMPPISCNPNAFMLNSGQMKTFNRPIFPPRVVGGAIVAPPAPPPLGGGSGGGVIGLPFRYRNFSRGGFPGR